MVNPDYQPNGGESGEAARSGWTSRKQTLPARDPQLTAWSHPSTRTSRGFPNRSGFLLPTKLGLCWICPELFHGVFYYLCVFVLSKFLVLRDIARALELKPINVFSPPPGHHHLVFWRAQCDLARGTLEDCKNFPATRTNFW